MELKWLLHGSEDEEFEVSIVPLWNWNSSFTDQPAASERFNRTFMELKYPTFIVDISTAKFQSYLYGIEMQYRTQRNLKRLRVSIVPLWNWN